MANQQDENTHSDNTDTIELSTIKIFNFVKKQIEKINTPPLTLDLLEVNEDAYSELGGDDDTSENSIFARIGFDFPKSYHDLPFMLVFDREGAALSVGALDFVYAHYEHLGENERVVASKLVAILTGLANGQLAVLNTLTQDNEKVQAWEMLYRKPKESYYDAITTYATFDSARKLKGREITTQKFANAADIAETVIDMEIYRHFTYETNWLNQFNRTHIASLHIPLTRDDWEKSIDRHYNEKTEGFLKNVDRWEDKVDHSLWERVLNAVKWRHLELMWWTFALLLFEPIRLWSLDAFHPVIISFGVFVIAATIYRRNPTFYRYYPWVRPIAYVSFILSSVLFISHYDASIWWFVLALIAALSLLENIFFDVRERFFEPKAASNQSTS